MVGLGRCCYRFTTGCNGVIRTVTKRDTAAPSGRGPAQRCTSGSMWRRRRDQVKQTGHVGRGGEPARLAGVTHTVRTVNHSGRARFELNLHKFARTRLTRRSSGELTVVKTKKDGAGKIRTWPRANATLIPCGAQSLSAKQKCKCSWVVDDPGFSAKWAVLCQSVEYKQGRACEGGTH